MRKRRATQMVRLLKTALSKYIRAIAMPRPAEAFKAKDRPALERIVEILKENGISVVFRNNIHQKFAGMDQKTVWYGSINLLSYGSAQESIMRIESSNIANELMRSIKSQ